MLPGVDEERVEEIAGGSGLGAAEPDALPPLEPDEPLEADGRKRVSAGAVGAVDTRHLNRVKRGDLAPEKTAPSAADEPIYPDLSKGHAYERPPGLFRSAVLKTGQMIAATEAAVAEGWKKAKGTALAFSGGFSWKVKKDGEPEVVRRWTAKIEKKPRSRKKLALACALLLALGAFGVWYATRPVDEHGKREPLF